VPTEDKDAEGETWRTRREAAAELSALLGEDVTANVLNSWARDPACPIPSGHHPIPKQPLVLWAQTMRRQHGGGANRRPSADESDLRVRLLEEQIRNLEGKNQRLWEESVNAEEARTGVVRAVEELRRELTQELPSAIWATCQGKGADESVPLVRQQITDALNRFHTRAMQLAK
jgi:hypothetical protein